MNPVIEADNLSKWFGEVIALNKINVQIGPGVTGLLGPNGAGKSTFLKLVLGLYRPSQGQVRVLGAAPRNNFAVLRRIGYCPESEFLIEPMTGFEFVAHLNRSWGMNRRAARAAAEETCALVRMTARMHDPIHTYSKGMRQRIKLAQALATRPDLLVLDEPMAGLDPRGREELYGIIETLGATGRSILFSSHILYEIERITSKVVLLYRGSLLAQGEVAEIRQWMDQYPHTIRVVTPEPRKVAAHFLHDAGLARTVFEDDALVLHTRAPNECFTRLNQLMLDGAPITAFASEDENLEAVFDYLTR